MSWTDVWRLRQRVSISGRRRLPTWVTGYALPTALAGLFLVLWIHAQPVNADLHNQYVSALRQMQELDARINQNLLQVRLGLLNNYDPIIAKQASIEELHQLLATPPAAIGTAQATLQTQVEEHRQRWQNKNELIQRFKTDHAVLRNSLAYFPIAIASLSQDSSISPSLSTDLQVLLQDLLLFNLSATEESIPPIEQQLQQLREIDSASDIDLSNVVTHANLILEKRPATDQLVSAILTVPTRQQGTQLVETYDQAYQSTTRTANIYRFGLYALLTALVLGIATSIVSRLRAAAIAQQQSENTQQALFQAIPDFMLRMYRNSPFYDVVSAGKSLILPSPQVTHGNLYNVLPHEIAQRRLEAVERVLNTQAIEVYEQQLERAGQLVWEEVRVVPCGKDDVLVMIRDICDRKQIEADLRQSTQAAQVANQAKSQFLSNMSHELRTPLNVILGFTQLMTRDGLLDPQQRGYLDSINQSGEHLLALINDVLEMSKIEAGRVTLSANDFDLHSLLSGIHTMFQFKASSQGVQFHLEKADSLPPSIHTDESKLRQIIINLVGNAVKFTPAGNIYLRAAVDPETETAATDNNDNTVVLKFEVEDTGLGIDPEDIDQLFDPFSQAKNNQAIQQTGTGLGLPISRKFVEMLGGEMSVSSQVGAGSLFCFSIQAKIALTAADTTTQPKIVGLAPNQSPYRILVVEDMPQNRELLSNLLVPIGFEVQEACNGLEALEICQQWQPSLVWMDLRMPVMDGYEATQRIKSLQNPPVVIALTGSAFKQEEQIALNAGCDDFVCKPFRTEVIFEKMAEFLGVSYVYDESIDTALTSPTKPLSAIDLQVMPPEWIAQLQKAATRVNGKEIARLLEEVPSEHAEIADYIARLAEDFCFEEIIRLTQIRLTQKDT